MASANNLLGLVNQLQNLEVSFSKILMETAMKLSALTDLNVFVLVETQDGRRFSGKRHLCDAYVDGSLTFQGSDVEFEINPSVFALQQRHHRPSRQSPQRRHQQHGRNVGGASCQRSPKRACISAPASSPAKRRRPNILMRLPQEGNDLGSEGGGGGGGGGGTEDSEVNNDEEGILTEEEDHLNSSGETTTTSSQFDDHGVATRLKLDPEALMEADVSEADLTDSQLDEQTGELRSPSSSTALVPVNGDHDFPPRAQSQHLRIDVTNHGPGESVNGVVGLLSTASSPRAGGNLHAAIDSSAKSLVDFDAENCEELNQQLMESLPHTLVSKLEGLSQFQSGPNLIPGSTEFRLLNR